MLIDFGNDAIPSTAALQTLCYTALMGGLNVWLRVFLSRPLVSASVAYWLGWSLVLFMTFVTEYCEWLSYHFSPTSRDLVISVNTGAAIGFGVATVLFPARKISRESAKELCRSAEFMNRWISNRSLFLMFGIGMFILASRIYSVGWNISSLRQVYSEREVTILTKFGSHLFVLCTVAVCSLGIVDAGRCFSAKRLLCLIGASAPISLAQGGRTFLLSFVIYYAASFFLFRSFARRKRALTSRAEGIQMGSLLTVLLFAFSVLGFLRGGYGKNLNVVRTVFVWPVSSLAALDTWEDRVSKTSSANGTLMMDMPLKWVEVAGLTRGSRRGHDRLQDTLDYFRRTGKRALNIPPTIVPILIIDFGRKHLVFGAFVLSVLLEVGTAVLSGKSWAGHLVASYLICGSFMTIQCNVFSPSFFAAMFWICVLAFIMSYRSPVKVNAVGSC